LLSFLYIAVSQSVSWGYLSRQEAFAQSFDMVWSTVQESHWDETFGGRDWEAIGNTYRPRLKKARDRTQLVVLLQSMLNELELSHYRILSNYNEVEDNYPRGGYTGLELKYVEGRAYVVRVAPGSPAEEAGIKVGWRLKSIHRRSIKSLVKSYSRKQLPDKIKSFYIQRHLNEVIQGGTVKRIRTDWYPPEKRALKIYMMPTADSRQLSDSVGHLPSQRIEFEQRYLENDILYMRFNYFVPNLMSDIRASIEQASEQAQGIIIDLRSNLGGLTVMATGISGLLVDEPTNLGKLNLKKGHMTYQGYPQRKRFSGPVAVLIDGSSASTSEMFAAGLQEAGRARVFGESSLGQSLPSLFKKLPSGDLFQYAVGDYHTPEGYRIEKNGVVPDEVLVPSFDQLEQRVDLPVTEALQWMERQWMEDEDAS
jgi:carboxyl-terminal processing protease